MNHINIHWNEKLEPRSPPFQVSALTSRIEIHARSCFFSLAKWISKCFLQSETALAGGTENFSMEQWVGRATLGDLSRLWKTLPEAGWAGGDSRGNLCPLSLCLPKERCLVLRERGASAPTEPQEAAQQRFMLPALGFPPQIPGGDIWWGPSMGQAWRNELLCHPVLRSCFPLHMHPLISLCLGFY